MGKKLISQALLDETCHITFMFWRHDNPVIYLGGAVNAVHIISGYCISTLDVAFQ